MDCPLDGDVVDSQGRHKLFRVVMCYRMSLATSLAYNTGLRTTVRQ